MKKALRFKQPLLLIALGSTLYASTQTLTISDCNLPGWKVYTESTGSVSFVAGPATPPLGTGSVRFALGSDGEGKAALVYSGLAGTPLSALTQLTYSTYVQYYTTGQAPALELAIDNTGDGVADDRLVFEPVYQTGTYPGQVQNGGIVLLNTWQSWNGITGGWWAASDETAGPSTYTLASYLQAHPTATIVNVSDLGALALTTGGGNTWDNFVGFADALTIGTTSGTTTFNFEACAQQGATLTVCHKGRTLTISPNALAAHLKHGDQPGPCITTAAKAAVPIIEASILPEGFALSNYPNPVAGSTAIRYHLPESSTVTLKVFDAAGRQIALLVNNPQKAGHYQVVFRASAYGQGVYYYTLQAQSAKGTFVQTKSMTIAR